MQERQGYQKGSRGKRAAVRRAFEDRIPEFQWFALDSDGMGTLEHKEWQQLERIFFGGRSADHREMNLGLSFTFNDRKGGRVVLLWVKNAEQLRFYITLRGVRRPLVAVSNDASEQTATLRFAKR